ncbi:Uu.00g051860.m01.CDS01 [Anthostomella pinea]|uniref:Uu.00g051860.m01.CDS01 n=1 Tax=Anthostomella pinea TaxID=933095 RepID=A0AAI8YPH7_9PEZI|nr:Uu.00g051860.m01.CDS01 [Anthostomella pinea]
MRPLRPFVPLILATLTVAAVPANSTGDASWPYQTYKSVNFTPPYLEISHRAKLSEGYLFFAPDGATEYELAPLIMDMDGELVWNGPGEHAFNFGVQTYHGEQVLVWWNGSLYPEPIGRGNGAVYMYNRHYEQIHRTTLAGNFLEQVVNATFPSNIDLHEIFITNNGTMLVTANNVTQADISSVGGPENGWVVAALIYEIDIAINKVLFSWNSLDHLDQLPFTASVYPVGSEGLTGASQSQAWGYFHINAVSPYDGGYLISSRFLCSAIAIAADGTVKWRLQGRDGGDFTLGNGTDFCYQHDIRAIPEQSLGNTSSITLHMHDNHNSPIDNGTVPTSGKSLSVDLSSKQVTLKHRYLNESGPIYTTAQGDYQPLADGNVFIGHGWIPVLEEFSHSGEILTTIQFGAAKPRPGGGFLSNSKPTLSYRAFKQPWTGCPKTKPDVVAETAANGNGTSVYMSWNGATEVEAWEIYAGSSVAELSCVSTVAKCGFETSATIDRAEYVQAKPQLRHRGHGHYGCEAIASEVISVVA